MKDLTSFNLVPRAGEMILSFSTSSSGDDARTSSIPFGKLAANGGEIFLPKALKLSIQASSDIPIDGGDIVCQAYKDAQGTQLLGSTFTQSKAAEIGPDPVAIGSIFCSDAGAVKARTGSDDASAQTSSAQSQPAQSQSTQAQTVGTSSRTGASPSAPTSLDYDTAEPTTIPQTLSSKSTSSASKVSSSIPSATMATTSPSPTEASSASAAAAQSTSGAEGVHTPKGWTVKRLANISVLAACYAAYFML